MSRDLLYVNWVSSIFCGKYFIILPTYCSGWFFWDRQADNMKPEHGAEFRFYAEQNDFLPPEQCKRTNCYGFSAHPAIKDPLKFSACLILRSTWLSSMVSRWDSIINCKPAIMPRSTRFSKRRTYSLWSGYAKNPCPTWIWASSPSACACWVSTVSIVTTTGMRRFDLYGSFIPLPDVWFATVC